MTDTAQRCAGPGTNLHRVTRVSCRQRQLFPAPTRLRFQNQHTAALPSTLNGRMHMAACRGRATALVCQAEAAGPAVRAGNRSAPLTCPCRSPQPGCQSCAQSCAQMLRWSSQVRGPPSTHLPALDSELAAVRREHAPRRRARQIHAARSRSTALAPEPAPRAAARPRPPASQVRQRVNDELVALGHGRARVHRVRQRAQVRRRLQARLRGEVEQQVEVRQALRVRPRRATLQVLPQLRLACAGRRASCRAPTALRVSRAPQRACARPCRALHALLLPRGAAAAMLATQQPEPSAAGALQPAAAGPPGGAGTPMARHAGGQRPLAVRRGRGAPWGSRRFSTGNLAPSGPSWSRMLTGSSR